MHFDNNQKSLCTEIRLKKKTFTLNIMTYNICHCATTLKRRCHIMWQWRVCQQQWNDKQNCSYRNGDIRLPLFQSNALMCKQLTYPTLVWTERIQKKKRKIIVLIWLDYRQKRYRFTNKMEINSFDVRTRHTIQYLKHFDLRTVEHSVKP